MQGYLLSTLSRWWENPRSIAHDLNRAYFARRYTQSYNPEGIDIFSEDWDNLIILDACRYDLFEEVNSISGRLERRISRGSNTPEFIRGNFTDQILHDCVYVTANPQFERLRDDINTEFHDVINVWAAEGWDQETDTVLPQTTTKYALAAASKYPNKRLFIHYLQPHYPFLGLGEGVFDSELAFQTEDGAGAWKRMRLGLDNYPRDEVWSAYRATLKYTLPHVNKLLDSLSGLTVISSDHGNMIGDRSRPIPAREWGHPENLYTKELVTVPWLVRHENSRRKIVADPPTPSEDEFQDGTVVKKLESLGYI